MARVGIALGSNVGDRLENLRVARDRLSELHEGAADSFLVSPIYQTEPVNCEPGTAAFFNAVIELESGLAPVDLLDACQAVERDLGRPDVRTKNSPRTIDVDLLYSGEARIATDRLELPHPRLLERRFVLIPLAEILGDRKLPALGISAIEAASQLSSCEPLPQCHLREW